MSRTLTMEWRGAVSRALLSTSRYLDVEGGIRSGKTTMALWKVLEYCLKHPGIHCLIARYSEDNLFAIVRPLWRDICLQAGVALEWVADESFYRVVKTGARVYFRGLKSSDDANRYGKFRGLTLAVIYLDQAEEAPMDYWPELVGRLSQKGYPQQIILTPNPPGPDHWIARQFPEDNSHVGYEYIRVATYDNAANLDASYIAELEAAYPPGHAKRGPLLLGIRGLNVKGEPVYGGYFRREFHVKQGFLNRQLPLCEAIDFGRHHPCVVWAQFTPTGALYVLGGIMGQDLFLEDFLPILRQYRTAWFPNVLDVQSCCDPAGAHGPEGLKRNAVEVLREAGIGARWVDQSNAPDMRRGAIERLAGYMRKRTPQGEGFLIDDKHWLVVSAAGARTEHWLANGCEAGYVWDERVRQVGSKSVVVPVKDGWYEHGQNALEYLELNFGGAQPTQRQVEQRAGRMAQATLRRSQRDTDSFRWQQRVDQGRGGYR